MILEQYSGHTISVTNSDFLLGTCEINEYNILDGNILKFKIIIKGNLQLKTGWRQNPMQDLECWIVYMKRLIL